MFSSLTIAFILYCIALISLGFYAHQRNKSASDFHLGGRRVNYWVTAISAHAGDMSHWLFIGFPFLVYSQGLVQLWVPIGLFMGMWANWHYIAARMRGFSEKLKSETIPDFLSKSTGDEHGIVKLICCFFCIFFFLFYIASGLKGVGVLLNQIFSVPMSQGVLISALVIIAYTTVGGFFAISFVGAFQGLFLLFMLLLVPFAMFNQQALDFSDFLSLSMKSKVTTGIESSFIGPDSVLVALSWGLGYFGIPHVQTKFMGIDSVKSIRKSKYVGMTWQFLALGSATAIGLFARAYFQVSPVVEKQMFVQIVTGSFVPVLAGFVFCAVLAATISTVDSMIMVSATSMTKDVLKLTGHRSVLVSRICIVFVTLTAAFIALTSNQSINHIVHYAWMGQGSSFGPLVIAVLYFRKNNCKSCSYGNVAWWWNLYCLASS